jgi:hypothetical protein
MESLPHRLIPPKPRIATIPERPRAVPRVPPEHIESVADGHLRPLLLRLAKADANALRNQVVHKDAYRPTLEEAKATYDETREILFGLTTRLRLSGNATWYLNGTGR